MTVFSFSMGKCLILDCTCVDSFSHSALALTATEPGSASRSAEVCKNLKYEGLCGGYILQAIAIETSCVFGRDTNAFIFRLGHLSTSVSGEHREAEFLRQRLSLATVRGNAQSVTQAGRSSSSNQIKSNVLFFSSKKNQNKTKTTIILYISISIRYT